MCCCFIIHDQNFSLPIIIALVCGLRPREVFSIIFIFIPTVFSVKSVPFQLLCSENCLAHKVVCLDVGLSWTLLYPGSWPVACYYIVSKSGFFFFLRREKEQDRDHRYLRSPKYLLSDSLQTYIIRVVLFPCSFYLHQDSTAFDCFGLRGGFILQRILPFVHDTLLG